LEGGKLHHEKTAFDLSSVGGVLQKDHVNGRSEIDVKILWGRVRPNLRRGGSGGVREFERKLLIWFCFRWKRKIVEKKNSGERPLIAGDRGKEGKGPATF